MTKCTTNASNVVHLYHKSEEFVPQSEAIYYINVPQSEGCEKKYHIEALVREKAGFRGHPSSLNRVRDRRETRLKERETD